MKRKSSTIQFVLMVVAVLLLTLPGTERAQALEYGGDGPELFYNCGYSNQHYRVDIMKLGATMLSVAPGDVLLNIFKTNPGDPMSIPPTAVNVDLSPWTGQTVRLRFAKVDNLLGYNGSVDDISLDPILSHTSDRSIEKNKLEGPDEIGIYLPTWTTYVFEITYAGPAARIIDTVPAEFQVTGVNASAGDADWAFAKGGKEHKRASINNWEYPEDKSASIITWDVPEGLSTLTVNIQTRESYGKNIRIAYKPTSCEDDMELNDGAMAYQVDEDGIPILDEDGNMIPIEDLEHGSGPLTVDAVCGAKPCAPTGLVVTQGDTGSGDLFLINWDDVDCGDYPVKYNVYRNGGLIAEWLEDSHYDDEDLDTDVEYCYKVEAVYYEGLYVGNESDKTDEVCKYGP